MASSHTPTSSDDGYYEGMEQMMSGPFGDAPVDARLREEYAAAVAEDEAGRNRGFDIWTVLVLALVVGAVAVVLSIGLILVRIANEATPVVVNGEVCDTASTRS